MFRTTLSSVALFAATTAALAADLPARSAPPVFVPPPLPAFTWTGFYIGGNAGYTETTSNNVSVIARGAPVPAAGGLAPNGVLAFLQGLGGIPRNASEKRSGFIGGGQIGYNFQFGPSMVAGIEADIQGLPNSGSSNSITATPNLGAGAGGAAAGALFQSQNTFERRLDYLGTVRGRLGYAFDRVLVYGTGGLAYGQTRLGYGISFPLVALAAPGTGGISGANTNSKTSVGYTVGGGVEYSITNHWSVKAEGLYYDLGRQSVTANVPIIPAVGGGGRTETVTASVRNAGYIARAGLNYRFGFDPAPVVARY